MLCLAIYMHMTQHHCTQFLISVAPLTRIALTRDQSFFYTHAHELSHGTLVEIPMGRRTIQGIVTRSIPDFPRQSDYVIKPIHRVIMPAFLTDQQLALAHFISEYYFCPLGIVLPHFVPDRVHKRPGAAVRPHAQLQNITRTPDHNNIIGLMRAKANTYHSFLLHICSSADKFSILLSLIQDLLKTTDHQKQILYILPELIQVPFLEHFFMQFFPHKDIAIIHGKLGKGAYYDLWQKIKTGKIRIIIGTRRTVFLPFTNLGAIIIDDAHDMSHKQWEHYPLYDARLAADHLARMHTCPIIFTSATPRIIDLVAATTHEHHTYIDVPIRHATPIKIIDMKIERWEKNRSPLSRAMITHLRSTLKRNKQILIFVNRHGESAFTVCEQCRAVMKCPSCDRALSVKGKNDYICGHCRYEAKCPTCPRCHAALEHIGIGTARIAADLKKIFPHARCATVDSTTMKKSGSHLSLYRDFKDHKIDIVIGTQMITKGWHTDTVGLSVIVDMDNLLSLPAYDVNEKAFAFVIQMATRVRNGTLLVQSFQPEHTVLQKAQKYDFSSFYDDEKALRKILSYPPYATMIKLSCRDTAEESVNKRAQEIYVQLQSLAHDNPDLIISEPHTPLVPRVRGSYRRQIIIKCTTSVISDHLRALLTKCDITWSIDIDPVQLI